MSSSLTFRTRFVINNVTAEENAVGGFFPRVEKRDEAPTR